MKRKFSIILLLLALILIFTTCTALRPDTEKDNVIEKQDSNSTSADNKGNDEDKNANTATGKPKSNADGKAKILKDKEDFIKKLIEKRATEVLTAIKNYDLDKLADAVHPDKGVRFSPYGYIDVENHLVFTAEEVRNFATDTGTYPWGYYDATGEPINLTFEDYYKRFIYDVDFVNAEQIGYNRIIGRGNTLNNIFEVYKNAVFVEYHFPGFDPQYGGMDWRSLRLVFEKKNGIWYLVGIVHDEWTS